MFYGFCTVSEGSAESLLYVRCQASRIRRNNSISTLSLVLRTLASDGELISPVTFGQLLTQMLGFEILVGLLHVISDYM
jgi:hypothetical protein